MNTSSRGCGVEERAPLRYFERRSKSKWSQLQAIFKRTSMTSSPATESAPRLTRTQWLICIIAVIGFAFDTYELLMLPLIIRPALEGLGGLQFGSPDYNRWRDLFFYVPA